MHIEQNAPPGAFSGRLSHLPPDARERYESEFLRLYALRDAISAELFSIADVLNDLDGEPPMIDLGGARG